MGCPAKKVCNVAAGSALLANEPLVEAIVDGRGARRRRARHAQDPHGKRSRAQERARDRADRRGGRHPRPRGARPHACLRLRRPGGIRHDPRRQGGGAHPRHRQRRRLDARAGGARAAAYRRRRDHDRPRRARYGPGSFAKSATISTPGCTCRRRRWRRRGRRSCGTSTTTTRSMAKVRACGSRASISVGTRRSSPAAKRSGARSTRWRRASQQLAAVGRFFDTLAERGDRLDYRAPVAAIADAHSAFRRSRQESQRGGEALAA